MELNEQMSSPWEVYMEEIIIGLGAISLILLVMLLVLWRKMNRMRSDYTRMVNGANVGNIEQLVIGMQAALNRLQASSQEQSKILDGIQENMRRMKSKIGIHRYNAFGERGNDLSFSIAILNEYKDGIVMTGIHNREETYIYAKPIQQGGSTYTLTPEEKEAITRST
jgi:hypothetical protein